MDATTDVSLTVAEAAQILGVSERTVWRYLKAGRISGETVGPMGAQRTQIDPESVARLRERRGADPAAAELRERVQRLTEELAQVTAERDALVQRVDGLQLALGRSGVAANEGILGRAAVGVASAVAKIRSVRAA